MPGSNSAQFEVDRSGDYVRQLEQLLDRSPLPAYIKDRENRVTFANATMCERLGLPRDEVLGRTSHELWPREIADGLRANDERALTSGQTVVTEETTLEPDGPHVFLTSKYPILDEDGSVVAVGGMSTDITDLKRAESEALMAQTHLATAIESMTDAVSITDATGRLTGFNPAFVKFHRFAGSEDCVDTLDRFAELFEIFAADGEPAPQDQWPVPRALRGETGTDVEYGVRRKDTGETWVATYGYAPLRNAAGEITGTVAVGRDVTEQRRGEQRLAQVEQLMEAQVALVRSEEQFGLLAENITDVIWTIDLDTMHATYFTPSVERLLGYTPDEAVALEFEDLLTPDSLERVRATLAGGIQGAERGDMLGLRVTEVDQFRKDGSIVPTEVTTRFLPTPDGRPHMVLGITRDIAERKRAEEALGERQRQHETIIRTTLDGLLLTDAAGRVLEVNEAYCAMSGYSEQELLTMSIQDLEEMDAEEIASRMRKVASGVPDRFESRHRRKDGSLFDSEISIRYESTEGGWFAGFVRDITERRLWEQAVLESEERYRLLAETSPDLIFVIDSDDRVVYVNGAAARSLNGTAEEIIGRSREGLFEPRSSTLMGQALKAVFESGKTLSHESQATYPGGVMWMKTTLVPMKDEEGRVVAVFGVARDLTDHKRAQDAVVRSSARLEGVLRSVVQTMGKVIEARDPYTQGHEKGVATIATLIAKELGLREDEVDGVEVAALVHDIGKLTVPAEILTKPGRLSDIEFSLIKVHSQAGYDILKDIDFDWPVADIVLQHHERMDGSGYPSGLLGDEISMAARILMVADVIEAMAAHRPYRPALGLDAAIVEITGHPEKFDPQVVAACVGLYEAGRIEL